MAKQAKQPPAKQKARRLAAPELNLVSLELAYRTSPATLEVIGKAHGISKGRVCQIAKERGWKRGDMQDRVRAKADAKVAEHVALEAARKSATQREAVSKTVRDNLPAVIEAAGEAAVDATAEIMAQTILRERSDVGRLLAVTTGLLDELETQGVKAAQKPGEGEADVGIKVDPLAVRIDNTRKLADTMQRLVTLERTVLNIAPDTPIDPSKRIEEAIDNGMAGVKSAFSKILGAGATP